MKRLYLIIIVLSVLLAVTIFAKWWLAVSVGLLILGALPYVERILNVKWSKKWSILFFALFIFFSGWNIIRSCQTEGTIDTLKKETKTQEKQIANLTEENEGRRKEVEQAKNDAAAAKAELADLSEYGEVATYTFNGYQKSGQFLSPFTPVSKWTEGYLIIREKEYLFNCNQDSINYYKSLIKKYPKFPFPYIALSRCLLGEKDSSWRQCVIKAQSILRKTTKIPLHSKEHDLWLEQVNKMLDPTQLNSVLTPGKKKESD